MTEELLQRVSSADSAILCGSAGLGRSGPISDLDFIAFDSSVSPQSEGHVHFNFREIPCHVVSYNPQSLYFVLQNEHLILTLLRELRKILQGQILFDNAGYLTEIRSGIANYQIPDSILAPFAKMAAGFRPNPQNSIKERLEFYFASENLSFAWLNSKIEYRYSKPKWLLDDVRYSGAAPLLELLQADAEDTCSHTNLREQASLFRKHIVAHGIVNDPKINVCFQIKDAESQLSAGNLLESVFPLRMAAYNYIRWWSRNLNLAYKDIRSITSVLPILAEIAPDEHQCITSLLSLNRQLPKFLIEFFHQAQIAFTLS